MRIVVTGGWGYRNLGDDAILASTIKNLKNVFHGCDIDVLTYDPVDTAIHKHDKINIHQSIHAYADFSSSGCFYKKLEEEYSLLNRIWLKFMFLFINSFIWSNTRNFFIYNKKVEEIISNSNLLVLAGGGYFNERWMSKSISHLLEMKMAIRFGVPFCIAGPTFGTFANKNIHKSILQIFKKSISIYVRDSYSLRQLKREQISSKLIPDIALSSYQFDNFLVPQSTNKIVVGVILKNKDKLYIDRLSAALDNFSTTCHLHVKIIMSRSWRNDFIACLSFQKKLRQLKLESTIILPDSYITLEQEINNTNIIISENLHGLIIAVRNLIPVIAINNHVEGSPNYNKFYSFMEQIGSQGLVINEKTTNEQLIDFINNVYSGRENFSKRAKRLCENVRHDTEEFFYNIKKIL